MMAEPQEQVVTAPQVFATIGDQAESGDYDENKVVDEIESMCMNCHENGMTKLLLTVIPFFKEVILMSFECPHCHFKNSEIQAAGQIQERGSRYSLRVMNKEDMDRQVVKSESCVCRFVELDVEIPAQRGQLTTVEGLLGNVLEDLAVGQDVRKTEQPEAYEKISAFLEKGRAMLEGKALPFTVIVDDIAGNSWIEPKQSDAQHTWNRVDYLRSPAQNAKLGLGNPEAPDVDDIHPDEVHTFPASCPSCARPCDTHMKLVDIPHFKEVVIMSTACDGCGYKSNEVKTGGAIPNEGRKITFQVEDADDLALDILKSESCAMSCPELSLDLHPGTLGGRFTTIEGLLAQVYDELYGRVYSAGSDSRTSDERTRWEGFLKKLTMAREGKLPFTLILDDPLAASYLQNPYAPEPNPQMTVETYERTEEQNEDYGLNDIRTSGYEADHQEELLAQQRDRVVEGGEEPAYPEGAPAA
ncbi:ZPR1 zinc-finger domain-domain-containing protein [Protomyces lactucae-debilis]|uniref:ZPR1 zinc-finger domain-domain-containing protein n=1 Tax=Protomyces lactucae-debilis TaxID=2754530 RepID=A0A1Y2FSC8_PROLT|nr:ZPR1 zinc-finger domain-containing protein [Protomyces lactucae-debilis]ORY85615.1 ZPR1 zinc-finger domain-domain-containing protein [Protomyces lactucae-debilis]